MFGMRLYVFVMQKSNIAQSKIIRMITVGAKGYIEIQLFTHGNKIEINFSDRMDD